MNRRAGAAVAIATLLLLAPGRAMAQVTLRPAPPPLVSAHNETWYVDGEPITFSGHFYYPTGPQVYFNPYEMVRSGFFHGVPLYTKTTQEPTSILYVPIGGGLMQPYERRRDRDLAGTTGSRVPSFPVIRDHEVIDAGLPQAPGPPGRQRPVALMDSASRTEAPAAPVASTGSRHGLPGHTIIGTGQKPIGLNAVFVEFQGQRWFNAGPPVELDRRKLQRIGERLGVPVYATGPRARTIYIPVAAGLPEAVVPYTRR